jgi:serine/threonine-protein kinase HipA
MMTMPDVSVLEVLLYGEPIATITRLQGDKTIFAFNESYVEDTEKPILSLSFKDNLGELITDFRPYQSQVMPFFSNLLPEGELRTYLADRAGVKPQREFFLLWVLGQDLPGAITIRPYEGEELPSDANDGDDEETATDKDSVLHFSLAGVQMKFSAIMNATGGLTIPAKGIGGSWIAKLPSTKFDAVPENEYAMMNLAQMMGMDVPETKLIPVPEISGLPSGVEDLKGSVLAVKRFDRTDDNERIHIEDFAQIFNLYPDDKYKKASNRNIAEVLAIETSEDDIAEFIRRLVYNTLIGNADMHVKNWSLIYYDPRTPSLSPAYDFVSTIAYLKDDNAGLKYARTRRMDELTIDELTYLAAKARLPEKLVIDTAKETVSNFHETWSKEKNNLTIGKDTIDIIEKHVDTLPIAEIE